MQTHSRGWKSSGEGSMCYLITIREEEEGLAVRGNKEISQLALQPSHVLCLNRQFWLSSLIKQIICISSTLSSVNEAGTCACIHEMDGFMFDQSIICQMLRMIALVIELSCQGWDSDCQGSRMTGMRDYHTQSVAPSRIHNTNISN